MDKEISSILKILKKQGINFHLETKVEKISKLENGVIIETQDKSERKLNLKVTLF